MAFELPNLWLDAVESAEESITIANVEEPDQPLVFINDAFTTITGYSQKDAIGQNCRFLQGPDTDKINVASIRHAIAEKRGITTELLNYTKNRTPFWNRVTLSPVASDPRFYIGVQTDISEYKITQAKLKEYADKMADVNENTEQSIRLLTHQLLAASSHSVKNVQRVAALINQEDKTDLKVILEHTQESLETLNHAISGLNVVLENCGGIDGLSYIDLQTLKVKDVARGQAETPKEEETRYFDPTKVTRHNMPSHDSGGSDSKNA